MERKKERKKNDEIIRQMYKTENVQIEIKCLCSYNVMCICMYVRMY